MSSSSSACIALLALAGCNQLFGSTSVAVQPGAQFDAPLDAPFACPAIGQTPQYSQYVHQFLARDCSFYGTGGSDAIASCTISGAETVVIGPIGSDLLPAVGLPSSLLPLTPRLAPDGQTILARSDPRIVEYARTGNTWTVATLEVFQLANSGVPFSSIAQSGSTLRVLMIEYSTGSLVEYERANGAWSKISTTPLSQLNLASVSGLALTGDGLRLVISTGNQVLFTDRPSLDAAFRPADPVQAPTGVDIFATDDCARIYLSGLGSVFYAQRL
jgi:hypothetical protein